MKTIEVTIRDGRAGRDPTQVDENGDGPVLEVVSLPVPGVEIGQLLTLTDGTKVKVIGYSESISTQSWAQTAYVDDVFEGDEL